MGFWIVNFLTFLRVLGSILLIPLFIIKGGIAAAILSAVCYFTDLLDGILSRKWHCATFFGSIFDSIADKIFTIINLVLLVFITRVALICILLEIITVIIHLVRYKKNLNIQSNIIGKIKIWITSITIVLLFILSDKSLDISYYSLILIPLIISEIITIISYLFNKKKRVVQDENFKKDKTLKDISFKQLLFDPELYEKYKNVNKLNTLARVVKSNNYY